MAKVHGEEGLILARLLLELRKGESIHLLRPLVGQSELLLLRERLAKEYIATHLRSKCVDLRPPRRWTLVAWHAYRMRHLPELANKDIARVYENALSALVRAFSRQAFEDSGAAEGDSDSPRKVLVAVRQQRAAFYG